MPRDYKRKEGARRYGYSSEAMQNALKEVKENGLSIKKAASLCGVNRTTLMNHLKEYRCGAVGRPTLLTQTEEGIIVHALKKLGEWGFGVDRNTVQCIVMDYLKNIGHQHLVRDSQPGIDWMYGFEKRWKEPTEQPLNQMTLAQQMMDVSHKDVGDKSPSLEASTVQFSARKFYSVRRTRKPSRYALE